VIEGAAARFDSFRVYAHREADVSIRGAEVVPTFRRRIRRFQVAALCVRLLREEGTILFTTAHNSDFRGVLWAMLLVRRPRARTVFLVHMHYPKQKTEAQLRGFARRRPDLLIVCPTPGCAADMRRMGFCNVQKAPYPHSGELMPPANHDGTPPHLLMPGVPRLDKGLGVVADYAQRYASSARVPLTVQVSSNHWNELAPGEREAIERLRRSGYPTLTLIEQHPDAGAYAAQFRGAIVLQPYEGELFAERISGVTLDALRAGCPIIVTAGTWMARYVDQYGAGVTIEERSAPALHQAVARIMADLDGYRGAAARAGAALAAEQAMVPLAELLTGEAGGPGQRQLAPQPP